MQLALGIAIGWRELSMSSPKTRMPIEEARKIATSLSFNLNLCDVRHHICGSLRRGVKKDVGDIDIVVSDLLRAYEAIAPGTGLLNLPKPIPPAAGGKERRTVNVEVIGINVNLYMALPDEWGAMELFLTGSGLFNIKMRGYAKSHGFKLNQYGLYKDDVLVASKTERDIFAALGLHYVSPYYREVGEKESIWKLKIGR